jgi:hypothetical protein
VPQVEAAAGAALAHGAIDAQSAQVIANSLALGGVGAVPSALMAKLRGEELRLDFQQLSEPLSRGFSCPRVVRKARLKKDFLTYPRGAVVTRT